jgi:hypothetical protein
MSVITYSSPMLPTFAGWYGVVSIQTCGGAAPMEKHSCRIYCQCVGKQW